jgi:hypothetical protein
MDPVLVVVLMFFLVGVYFGLAYVFKWPPFKPEEGEECKPESAKEDDNATKYTYQEDSDDKLVCTLKSCKAGWDPIGSSCIEDLSCTPSTDQEVENGSGYMKDTSGVCRPTSCTSGTLNSDKTECVPDCEFGADTNGDCLSASEKFYEYLELKDFKQAHTISTENFKELIVEGYDMLTEGSNTSTLNVQCSGTSLHIPKDEIIGPCKIFEDGESACYSTNNDTNDTVYGTTIGLVSPEDCANMCSSNTLCNAFAYIPSITPELSEMSVVSGDGGVTWGVIGNTLGNARGGNCYLKTDDISSRYTLEMKSCYKKDS